MQGVCSWRILAHEHHGVGRGQNAVFPLHFLVGLGGQSDDLLPLSQTALVPDADEVCQHLAVLPEGDGRIIVPLQSLRHQAV